MFQKISCDIQSILIKGLEPTDLGRLRQTSRVMRELVDENLSPSQEVLLDAGRRASAGGADTAPVPAPDAPLALHLRACVAGRRRDAEGQPPSASTVYRDLRILLSEARSMPIFAEELDAPSFPGRADQLFDLCEFIRRTPSFIRERLWRSPFELPRLHSYETRVGRDYIDMISPDEMTAAVMYGYDRYKRPFLAMRGVARHDDSSEYNLEEKRVGVYFQRYIDDDARWRFVKCHHRGPYVEHFLQLLLRGAPQLDERTRAACADSFDDLLLSTVRETRVPRVDAPMYRAEAASIRLV